MCGKAVTPFPATDHRQCSWSTHGRKCEDTEGEAEEREKVNKEAGEEECKRGRGSFLEKDVAMVCKRACCDFHSGMNSEEEVVNLSGDVSEHWCEASMCVLASVPIVTHLFSPVKVFCGCGPFDGDDTLCNSK